jgi:hypothetical protein
MAKLIDQFAKDQGDGTTLITGKCKFLGIEYSCAVPTDGLYQWLAGLSIQRAMPTVSADDREFLISGISPLGWEEKFGKY